MERTIVEVLGRLGISRGCKGFYYLTYAVLLASENPQCLLLVTKCLYPAVAKQFHTTPACVERNIRTAAKMAWNHNPAFLTELAKYQLCSAPTVCQLLSFSLAYLDGSKGTVCWDTT
jgi:hypothetical protein